MDHVDLSDACFCYTEKCFTAAGFLSAGDGDAPYATFFLIYLVGGGTDIVSLRCFSVVFPFWSVCSAFPQPFDGLVWRRRIDYYIRHLLLEKELICRCSGVDCRIQGLLHVT